MKYFEHDAKKEITRIFNEVSFQKFGNAFRKHIDPFFAREFHLKSRGGQVCKTFTWQELASYIIGDGDYNVTEDQFNAFMKEFKK